MANNYLKNKYILCVIIVLVAILSVLPVYATVSETIKNGGTYTMTSDETLQNFNLGGDVVIDGAGYALDGNGTAHYNIQNGYDLTLKNIGTTTIYQLAEDNTFAEGAVGVDKNGNRVTIVSYDKNTGVILLSNGDTAYKSGTNEMLVATGISNMHPKNSNFVVESQDSSLFVENVNFVNTTTPADGNLMRAIIVESNNKTSITSNFIGNYILSTSSVNSGGAIAITQMAKVGDIKGYFINNFVNQIDKIACGGAIFSDGKVGTIIGDFTGNYAASINDYTAGGAIYNNNTIDTIIGNFTGNYATSSVSNVRGGAIRNDGTIISVTGDFTDNYATSSGSYAYGGAIYNTGTIATIKTDFTNNSAISSVSYASGGAIYNIGTITNINDNYAETTGSSAQGGAIYNTGAITSINGDFDGNHAATTSGIAYGGAIYNYGTIETIEGNFKNNYTKTIASSNSPSTKGGAIYNLTGTITNINGNFYGNYAETTSSFAQGGAIYNNGTITSINGYYDGNYAEATDSSASGGAIFNYRTIETIEGNFKNNHAKTAASSSSYRARGGAIYNYTGTITNINGNFYGNYAETTSSSAQGGAIYNNGTITSINGYYDGNYAETTSSFAQGGAIYNNGTITSINGYYDGNYAEATDSNASGGAIYNCTNGTIDTIEGHFKNNYAKTAASSTSYRARGGAIYNSTGTITKINGNFEGNYAEATSSYAIGGAIYNNGTISTISSIFTNNHILGKTSYGGAIYNNGTITDIDGNFDGNYVEATGGSAFGGAIYNEGTITSITGDFTGNYTESSGSKAAGGVIYNTETITSITGKFSDNYSKSIITDPTEVKYAEGGAISIEKTSTDTTKLMIDTIEADFINNSVQSIDGTGAGGGAIYSAAFDMDYDMDVNLYQLNGNFYDNFSYATKGYANGGAIRIFLGNIGNKGTGKGGIIGNFVNNYALGYTSTTGGAISLRRGNISQIIGNFKNNYIIAETFSALGGAIYNSGTIGTIEGDFTGNYATTNSDNQLALGGAIFSSTDLNFIIDDRTSEFSDNYTQDKRGKINNAIFIDNEVNDTKIDFNITNNGKLIFNDSIDGGNVNSQSSIAEEQYIEIKHDKQYDLNLIGDGSGYAEFNSKIENANINVSGVTTKFNNVNPNTFKDSSINIASNTDISMNMRNGLSETIDVKDFSIAGNLNINLDLDLKNGLADNLYINNNFNNEQGKITINNINIYNPMIDYSDNNKDTLIINAPINMSIIDTAKQIIIQDNGIYNLNTKTTADADYINIQKIYTGKIDEFTASIQKDFVLSDTLTNINLSNERTFQATKDVVVTGEGLLKGWDTGRLGGNKLVINGNGYTINGNNHSGITIANGQTLEMTDANFVNFISSKDEQGTFTIKDDSKVIINATNSDVKISSASENAVYLDSNTNAKLEMTTNFDKKIIVEKDIRSNNVDNTVDLNGQGTIILNGIVDPLTINVKVDKVEANNYSDTITWNLNSGILHFTNDKYLYDEASGYGKNTLNFNGGTLDLRNSQANSISLAELSLNSLSSLYLDADLQNKIMDSLTANNYNFANDAKLAVKEITLLSDGSETITKIPFADTTLKSYITNEVKKELAYSPIYKYTVDYDDTSGEFIFSRATDNSENNNLSNDVTYEMLNPSVMATDVATQLGGQMVVNQAIKYSFQHSDKYFSLPKEQRANTLRNMYAITDPSKIIYNSGSLYEVKGAWIKPYTSFESVNLNHGPEVDLMSYGTIVGLDNDLIRLKNGWYTTTSAYMGYNGTDIDFGNVSTDTNGGLLGVTQTWYKDNFFTAITANAGASTATSITSHGKEDFAMFMSGIGSKTGYNLEFKEGQFIIQPTLGVYYSMVNSFDHTNAAGIRINTEPLHTLQLNPEVKFITNLKNNWQAYATTSMNFDVINSSNTKAQSQTLPSISVDPYVEYGVGIQRIVSEDFSFYAETTLRNGGRNGVLLNGGLRFKIGKKTDEL